MKPDRLPLAFLMTVTSVQAICLNPSGCEPKNYQECMADATNRPTELGVKLARNLCDEKWKWPEEERAAVARVAAAEKRAAQWEKLREVSFDAPGWIDRLGQPDLVRGPGDCTVHKGSKAPNGGCYTYYWYDNRPGRVQASFKAEVVNDPSKRIWVYWQDSISR